jgi:hypothetical protein
MVWSWEQNVFHLEIGFHVDGVRMQIFFSGLPVVICKASEFKEWVIAKQRSKIVNNMSEEEGKLTEAYPSLQIPRNCES